MHIEDANYQKSRNTHTVQTSYIVLYKCSEIFRLNNTRKLTITTVNVIFGVQYN